MEVLQENHYYPFGLKMEGKWAPQIGKENKYGYNSKELNDEFGLDWNDYGARFYDPAIARWNGIDPLGEIYLSISPYTYTLNNPIKFIDPDGMRVSLFDRMASQVGSTDEERQKSTGEFRDRGSSSNSAVRGLPIDLGAENIYTELLDGMRYIQKLEDARDANGVDDDDVIHTYYRSEEDRKAEWGEEYPYFPIAASTVCDYSCYGNNFTHGNNFGTGAAGEYFDRDVDGVRIIVLKESSHDVKNQEVLGVRFHRMEVLDGKDDAKTKFFIKLQIGRNTRPVSMITITTFNEEIFNGFRDYINH